LEEGKVRDKTLNKTPLASKETYKAKGVFFIRPTPQKKITFFSKKHICDRSCQK
jgi:hypothetical protein